MNWKGKNVLITGVAGFIGRNLSKRLYSEEGANIYGVDNCSLGDYDKIGDIKTCICNVDELMYKDTFEKSTKDLFDIVFHLGAHSSVQLFKGHSKYEKIGESMAGSYAIREFCIKHKIPKLVYISSATVYGQRDPPRVESPLLTPGNIYGWTKSSEELLDPMFPDLIQIGLRLFPAFGPMEDHKGDAASVPYIFCKDMINDVQPVIWGDGSQERDFIYIDDVINLILRSADFDQSDIINIGTGISKNFNYMVDCINQILGKDIEAVYIPNPYGDAYLHSLVPDATKMNKMFNNPQFTSFKDGLAKTINWIQEKTARA